MQYEKLYCVTHTFKSSCYVLGDIAKWCTHISLSTYRQSYDHSRNQGSRDLRDLARKSDFKSKGILFIVFSLCYMLLCVVSPSYHPRESKFFLVPTNIHFSGGYCCKGRSVDSLPCSMCDLSLDYVSRQVIHKPPGRNSAQFFAIYC